MKSGVLPKRFVCSTTVVTDSAASPVVLSIAASSCSMSRIRIRLRGLYYHSSPGQGDSDTMMLSKLNTTGFLPDSVVDLVYPMWR